MNAALLEDLLRGKHISMEDRLQQEAWPHPPIRLRDCVRCITDVLKRERWFPREWRPAVEGEVVHEGGVIERAAPTRYVYRNQRHHPMNPTLLAETSKKVFWSGARAARYYLQWDLSLPGRLDGYDVVDG